MKTILTFNLLFASILSFSQGFLSNGTNTYLTNSTGSSTSAPFPFLGLGTNTPTEQLHTKLGVRLEGINQNNNLSQLLVRDNSGKLFWRDASTITPPPNNNFWSLTGNAGTNPNVNFLGTTDANPLILRTNNVPQMRVNTTNAVNVGVVEIGLNNYNGNLAINGKDLVGFSIPLTINSSTTGQIYNQTASTSHTLGRIIRLNQVNTNTNGGIAFYDMGIGAQREFYIMERGMIGGPFPTGANIIPKKMFVISENDQVGINLGANALPTADFHTQGSVRFQNLPSGSGNILVIDAAGNVRKANSSAFKETPSEVTDLKNELEALRKEIEILKQTVKNKNSFISQTKTESYLNQNKPNPFKTQTKIEYFVASLQLSNTYILVTDLLGKELLKKTITQNGKGEVMIDGSTLLKGLYVYSLIVNNEIVDSKKMIIME
jgi:Secretion system C-terminal sorting domain